MSNQGRNKSTICAVYLLQGGTKLLASLPGIIEGELCTGKREKNYLPNDVHEVDAKERKKKNDGWKRGQEREDTTRDLSLLCIWVVDGVNWQVR
jgi:hypothetical protein